MSNFKPCTVCGAKSDARLSTFCSQACSMISDEVKAFSGQINLFRSEDSRIFFYDFAFGDLCDLWSTYLLRRIRTRDLGKARQVDRALEKLEKAILTKLNRFIPAHQCETRKLIGAILPRLVGANARIWDWKDAHMGGQCPKPDEWSAFREMYAERDACRQQLDALIDGHTMTTKTYENITGSYDVARIAETLGFAPPRPNAR